MSYFKPCPICGANLDPNEVCECRKMPPEVGASGSNKEISTTAILADKKGNVNYGNANS